MGEREALLVTGLREHDSIKKFIDRVKVHIYTQEEAIAIEDELIDHLFDLTQDYLDSGHNKEQAISKALLQMGDPSEIGYSFTDFGGAKKRRIILVLMKTISIAILMCTLIITAYLVDKLENPVGNQQTMQTKETTEVMPSNEADTNNQLETQNIDASSMQPEETTVLDQSISVMKDILDWISPFLIYIIYFPMAIYFNVYQNGSFSLNGISMNALDIRKEPLLILWSYKKRFPWEYVAIVFFFMPVLIIFGLLYLIEGSNPIALILFVFFIAASVWMYFYSEKFRIPKYVVLDDGLLVKNKLITWASIDKFSWTKDYMSSNTSHYKLIIENIVRQQNSLQNRSNLTIKKVIDVNGNQFAQMNAILKERV